MAHAEICPVCRGEGMIKMARCHGCMGTGWITVQDRCKEYELGSPNKKRQAGLKAGNYVQD